MKKRPFANSKCSEVVKTIQKQKAVEYQEERFRPESYRRKTRNVIRRLREHTERAQATNLSQVELRRSTGSWPELRAVPASGKHLDSLEALSYQARFSTSVSTRVESLEGLVAVDRFAEATLITLEEALDDHAPEVRAKSAELLGSSPPPLPESMMDKLIARVWDPELIVRKAVARTLPSHPDPRAIGPLMGLLGTQDDELREIVHESLVDICTKLGPPPPRTDGDT